MKPAQPANVVIKAETAAAADQHATIAVAVMVAVLAVSVLAGAPGAPGAPGTDTAAAMAKRARLLPSATAAVAAMIDRDAPAARLTLALNDGGEALCSWPLPSKLMQKKFPPSSSGMSGCVFFCNVPDVCANVLVPKQHHCEHSFQNPSCSIHGSCNFEGTLLQLAAVLPNVAADKLAAVMAVCAK